MSREDVFAILCVHGLPHFIHGGCSALGPTHLALSRRVKGSILQYEDVMDILTTDACAYQLYRHLLLRLLRDIPITEKEKGIIHASFVRAFTLNRITDVDDVASCLRAILLDSFPSSNIDVGEDSSEEKLQKVLATHCKKIKR